MMRILLFIFAVLTSTVLNAQKDTTVYAEEDLYEDDPYFWSYTKEIGINFTPFVSKFVPFNLGENSAGPIGIKYKRYYSKRAFVINFGADISSEIINNGVPFFFLGIGAESRKPITKDKKITYSSGLEIFLSAADEDIGTLGIAKNYGLQYHFTKRIFLSTDAALRLGSDFESEGITIKFELPVALFVNVRLY
jgi:hypothetical protein